MHTSNKTWTFGVVTKHAELQDNKLVNNTKTFLQDVIDSINFLNISKDCYEIIVIGSNNLKADLKIDNNLRFIYFDESIKDGWITRKKNILIENSIFENVCLVHDYINFNSNWYRGFQQFDTDWDVCMIKIFNKDGIRWRDWLVWPHCPSYEHGYVIEHNNVRLAPNRLLYSDTRYTNINMYISGTVIIGKRNFLLKNKFDETLCWGQGEDCEWSGRCLPNWVYKMNINSSVNLLKMGQHSSLF